MRSMAILLTITIFFSAREVRAEAPPAPYANIHTIGIVAAIGDEVTLTKRGITLLDTSNSTIHLNWGIDEKVSDYLMRALRAAFAVKLVNADADLQRAFSKRESNTLMFTDYMRLIGSQANVDALIVVLPTEAEEQANPSRYSKAFHGLGVYRDTDLFHAPDYVMLYAMFDLLVVDARTGALISRVPSRTWGGPPFREGPITSACPANVWAAPSDLTDVQRNTIRDQMTILIFFALPRMLSIAGLPFDKSVSASVPAFPVGCGGPD